MEVVYPGSSLTGPEGTSKGHRQATQAPCHLPLLHEFHSVSSHIREVPCGQMTEENPKLCSHGDVQCWYKSTKERCVTSTPWRGKGRVLGDRVGWKPSQLCRGPGGVPSHLLCKRGGFIARIHTDSCSGNGLVGDQDLEGANLVYQRQEGLGKEQEINLWEWP